MKENKNKIKIKIPKKFQKQIKKHKSLCLKKKYK
jgi:hypothetical protein